MTKAEVCEYLGKSKRTVETFISRGRLAATYYNGPNGKTASFDAAAVKALKRELDTPMYRAVVPIPISPAIASEASYSGPGAIAGGHPHPADPAAFWRAAIAEMSGFTTKLLGSPREPAPKPWLTLAEAAEYSGLPASWLLAQARLGCPDESQPRSADVIAINVGTEKKRVFRFNRESLGK